jgi:4-amino-4-deoxy-L-arabinose transferase-like glycosyltransferase/membrane-associated phospholipid phosphatase
VSKTFAIFHYKAKFWWQKPKAIALGAVLFLLLSFLLFQKDTIIVNAVHSFSSSIHQSSWFRELFRLIRPFGKNDVLIFITFLIGIRYRHKALQILLSMILVGILIWPLKLIVERERPNPSDTYSFPSGDTAAVTAFVVPIIVQSAKSIPLGAGLVFAVGAIRIFDGAHYPSDVLGGVGLGILASSIVLAFGISIRRRWLRPTYFLYAAGIILIVRLTKYIVTDHGLTFMDFFTVYGIPIIFMLFARYSATRVQNWKQLLVDNISSKRNILIFLAISVLLTLFFLTTRSTLWDRDEPQYTEATISMVTSGNYLYPTFDGKVFSDKPVLMYWLMSMPIRLFGVSEFACRFFSPIAIVITGLITALIGWRLFNPFAGVLGMAMLFTTPMIIINGTLATADSILLVFISSAIMVIALSNADGLHGLRFWIFAGCLILGILTKGPIIVIPVFVAIITLVFSQHFSRLSRRQLIFIGLAGLLAVLAYLIWFVPANIATGGEFLRTGIGRRIIQQTFFPLQSHGGNRLLYLPYYLPVILCGFFPWILYLPAVVSVWAKKETSTQKSRLLLLNWILSTLCIFTFVATKLPHYILPCWPALALASAYVLYSHCVGTLSAKNILWLKRGIWLFVPIGFLFGIMLLIVPWFLYMPGARIACTAVGIQLLVLTAYGFRIHRAGRFLEAAVVLFAGIMLIQFTFALTLLPSIETLKVSPRIAKAINKKVIINNIPSNVPDFLAATRSYREPSLLFYLQKPTMTVIRDGVGVSEWARNKRPGILIIPRIMFNQIKKEYGALPLYKIAIIKGFNYSKGKWVELFVLDRGGRLISDKLIDRQNKIKNNKK